MQMFKSLSLLEVPQNFDSRFSDASQFNHFPKNSNLLTSDISATNQIFFYIIENLKGFISVRGKN